MGWSKEQDDYIRKQYPLNVSAKEIGMHIGKEPENVRMRAFILGVKKGSFLDEFLIQNYKKIPTKEISEKFNVTMSMIRRRASVLGLCEKQMFPYSNQTIRKQNFVKENFANKSLIYISAKTGIPEYSIRSFAKKCKLKKEPRIKNKPKKDKRRKWSYEQEEFLKSNCEKMNCKQLSAILKKDYHCVRSKIRDMNLDNINLKIYKAGQVSFVYNTSLEREYKLEYITMYVKLLKERGIGNYVIEENVYISI